MMLKAALFDMDGLLIDSETLYRKFWKEAARLHGYELTDEMALTLRSLDASLARKSFEKWFGSAQLYDPIRETRRKVMAEYVLSHPDCLHSKDGAAELIRYLQEKNITVAVATATDSERAGRYLKRVGLSDYIPRLISARDVGRGKPFPDVYLEACRIIGFAPEECAAFEDSPNGVQSAHSAGCFTIMIPDQTPFTEDLAPYVDRHYSSLREVIGAGIFQGHRAASWAAMPWH